MARDGGGGDSFVFDLVDDDESADLLEIGDSFAHPASGAGSTGGAGGPGDAGGAHDAEAADDRPPVRGTVRRDLWLLGPVAATLAIVLGTGLTIDSVRDAERVERVRELPGGVVDLSVPPEQLWDADPEPRHLVGPMEGAMAVLGGDVTFLSGSDLVGLDVVTGSQEWSVPLGADPDCGPLGIVGWTELTTSAVVCLDGEESDRAVTRVGPDGERSTRRPLDPIDTRRHGEPRPGPDGTVLRAHRVGPESAVDLTDARCDTTNGCTGTVRAGRPLELRAEDAATGEERWTTTVPFRPVPAEQCSSWTGTQWVDERVLMSDTEELAPETFGAEVADGLVNVHGCGIESAVTADGHPVGADLPPGASSVRELHSGQYMGLAHGAELLSTLYARDGTVLFDIPGYAFEPEVADGSGRPILLAADGDSPRLRAHERDGTVRWDVRQEAWQRFLAQVGGTAVIMSGTGAVRGLDVATGAELWKLDSPYLSDSGDAESRAAPYVTATLTDGRYVLLQLEGVPGGGKALVSFDAVSGEVVWTQGRTDDDLDGRITGGLFAVDGHLVEMTGDGIRGLG